MKEVEAEIVMKCELEEMSVLKWTETFSHSHLVRM